MFILIIALALLVAVGLSLLPVFSPVEWSEDLGDRNVWVRLCGVTAALSSALVVAGGIGTGDKDLWRLAVVTVGTAVLSSVFIQTAVTDFKLHLADRRLFNIGSPIAAVVGLPYLVAEQDWITMTIVVMLTLFAAFVYLFIYSIGASDARALVLMATAAAPAIGWNGFVLGSLIAGLYFIVIGLGVAFIRRTLKSHFPAVPMLLFPYWAILVVMPWVTLPNAFPTLPI